MSGSSSSFIPQARMASSSIAIAIAIAIGQHGVVGLHRAAVVHLLGRAERLDHDVVGPTMYGVVARLTARATISRFAFRSN